MFGPLEFATCRHCHQPIARMGENKWLHVGPDWMPLEAARGCRAASYNETTRWDDTLDRSWTATPDRSTITREHPPGLGKTS